MYNYFKCSLKCKIFFEKSNDIKFENLEKKGKDKMEQNYNRLILKKNNYIYRCINQFHGFFYHKYPIFKIRYFYHI